MTQTIKSIIPTRYSNKFRRDYPAAAEVVYVSGDSPNFAVYTVGSKRERVIPFFADCVEAIEAAKPQFQNHAIVPGEHCNEYFFTPLLPAFQKAYHEQRPIIDMRVVGLSGEHEPPAVALVPWGTPVQQWEHHSFTIDLLELG